MTRAINILFILFLFFTTQLHAAEIVDRVVAVVNDDVITLTELNEEAEPVLTRINLTIPPARQDQARDQARKEILASMIDQLLIRQVARQRHITISEEEVDQAIQGVLAKNQIDMAKFRQELARIGSNEGLYRKSVRSEILKSKLIGYEIHSRLVITDEQIEEYYHNQFMVDMADGYHLLQFGLAIKPGTADETSIRIRDIRQRIINGESFRQLCREFSTLPSAVDGGNIGSFKKSELAPYMWDAIKDLQPGDLSSIIQRGSGLQFFKLVSIKEGDRIVKPLLAKVKQQISNILRQQMLAEEFSSWVDKLRRRSYIEKFQ